MESYKISRAESRTTPNIETTADYEGNATELLIERITNPHIRQQIVGLLREDRMHTVTNNRKNLISYGKPEEELVQDQEGNILPAGYFIFEEPSLEGIERDFDERIREISASTPVSFSPDELSSREAICVNSPFPGQERMTTKQLSIVEAHEKGHVMRPYFSTFLDHYFRKGFDPSRAVFSAQDPLVAMLIAKSEDEEKTPEALHKNFSEYLFSAHEIAERMSQLKNYFGMRGNDIFTKGHLNYARQHYILDTGMDNHMTQFFQAITPATEDAFIKLINSSGI